MNEPSASSAVGMTTMPLPVSRWTARQFTSTICPRMPPISIQSPSSNGASKMRKSPETIEPTDVLQREADDDRGDAEGGEDAGDVGIPHPPEQQRDAEDDEDEADDVAEDRREPVAPRPLLAAVEDEVVDRVDDDDDHEQAEDRRR